MSNPHLHLVSDAVAVQANDAMAELGAMTIGGVIGTYQANKDACDALLIQALSLAEAGEAQTEQCHRIFCDLERAQRRLWIYSMLASEVFG